MSFSQIERASLILVVFIKIYLSWNQFYADVMDLGLAIEDMEMLEYDLARTEEQIKEQTQVNHY